MSSLLNDQGGRRRLTVRQPLFAIALVVATAQAGVRSAHAQPAPPVAESTQTADSLETTNPAAADPPVRRIYVPVSELGHLLNEDERRVLLRRDEFRRLWRAAEMRSAAAPRRPVDIVLSSADYEARLEGDLLILSAQVQFTQLSPGWCVLKLPVGGLNVVGASLDGVDGAISRDPGQPETLLVFSRTRGDHQLSLQLTAGTAAAGSDRLAEFALCGAPSGTLTVVLPKGKSLLVDGLATGGGMEAESGMAYRIPIGGRSRVALRITDGADAQAGDILLLAQTVYGLRAAPGEVTWVARSTLSSYGRTLDQLKFTVPGNLEVAAVESDGLSAWDMQDADGNRTEITLDYREPASGPMSVTIRGVFAVDDDHWQVPALLLDGADSHVATILVQHDPVIHLQPEAGDGVRPLKVEEVARGMDAEGSAATDRRMAFQSMRADFELSFYSPRRTGAMQAAMTNLLHVSDDGLDLASIVDVQPSGSALFEVRVGLPAEFAVTEVRVAGRAIDWQLAADEVGRIDVLIPLDAPLNPGESLRLELRSHAAPEDWPVESSPVLIPLPGVELPQASMLEARYGITTADELEVSTVEVAGFDAARGSDAVGLRRQVEAVGRELKLGFTYQDSEVSGELEVTRRPAMFSVSTLWLSRLEPQRTITSLESTVTVEQGGLEGLLIELPDSVGPETRFALFPVAQDGSSPGDSPTAARIVEQSVGDSEGGRRMWALRFDRRLRGAYKLAAVLVEPRGATSDVALVTPVFPGADRQHGWIAVEARDDQRLTVAASDVVGRPLRPVDPIDLPGMGVESPGERRIVAGFRFARPGATATVVEESLEPQAVPSAIVDLIDLRSQVAPSGRVQHRLEARLRAVGVQSLQLELPDEADLWGVAVDGQPIAVRRLSEGIQVPLPPLETPEVTRSLVVFYASQRAPLGRLGRLQEDEPRLMASLGAAPAEPLEVLARDWTLRYPRDVVLLESSGRFAPASPLQYDTLISRVTGLVEAPSASSLAVRLALAGGLLLILWLATSMLRATARWAAVLIVTGVVMVVLLMVLAFPPIRQEHKSAEFFALGELPLSENVPSIAVDRSESTIAGRSTAGSMIRLWQSGEQAPGGEARTAAAAREELDSARRGALLSLTLSLDSPPEMRETAFRSVGAGSPGTPGLDVRYASRSHREIQAGAAALGVLLVMWRLRRASARTRVMIAVLAVMAPLALVTVVPSWSSMLVEGGLVGGITGLTLWSVRSLVQRWCPSAVSNGGWSRPVKVVALCIAIVGNLAPGTALCTADELSPAASDHGQHPSQSTEGDERGPTILVPYADGDPLSADHVLLPQRLFDQLQSQADPDDATTGSPRIAGVVSDAEYAIRIGDQSTGADRQTELSVSARFTVHGFRAAPAAVAVPIAAVAVTWARLDDVPATVRPAANAGLEVLIPGGTGVTHHLELSFTIPAKVHAASGEFTLPALPVAAGRLLLTLPLREDWRVSAVREGRTPVAVRGESDGHGEFEIPVDRGGPLTVSWQPDQATAGGLATVNVESTTAIQIDDAGMSLRASYDVAVRQGTLEHMVFDVPASLRLKRVWGPDVGGWELAEHDGQRALTVQFRRAIDSETRILADLFFAAADVIDDSTFDVPSPAARDVTRESGQVILLSDDVRELRLGAVEGLLRTEATDVRLSEELNPGSLPVRGTFRFTARPWRLPVSPSVRPPQIRVTADHGMFVGRRRILLSSRLEFDLAGAPRRLLRVQLPQEYLMTDVQSDDVREWFVEDGELLLDLGEPRGGAVTVAFHGQIRRGSGESEVVLETPLPQDVTRQESRLIAWVEEGLSLTIESHEGWRPMASDQLPEALRRLHEQPAHSAFRSTEIEPELVIAAVDQIQPRLAGDAVTLIAVSDASVDYGLTLRWTIEQAGVDRLAFTTPDWLSGRLEFTGEGIRQISSENMDDERVRWTVQLEGMVIGTYLLSAVATIPAPADGRIAAPDVRFEQAADADFTSIEPQRSFALLVNLSAAQLVPVDEQTHETVRAERLPLTLRSELVAQAMEVVRVPIGRPVVWQLQSTTERQTAAATVTSADLTTVLAADGSWRTQADYRIRNRGHQFLAVRIPDGARLLSAIVRGRPARVLRTEVNEQPVVLAPLPQTSAADLSFVVRLVFAGALPRPLSQKLALWRERVALPVPVVMTPRQSATYGVPVVATNWTVTVPDDFEAAPADSSLTNMLYHPEGHADILAHLQELKERAELKAQVLDRSLSLSQRSLACANLRVMNSDIQKRSIVGPAGGGRAIPPELATLANRQEELVAESLRAVNEFEAMISNQNANGVLLFDGVDSGRQYILGNSVQIQQDNRPLSLNFADPETEAGLRFDRLGRDDGSASAKGQAAGEKGVLQSRSLLREKLAEQEALTAPASDQPIQGQMQVPQAVTGSTIPAPTPAGSRMDVFDRGMRSDGMAAQMTSPQGFGGFDASETGGGVAGVDADAAPARRAGALSLPLEISRDGRDLDFSKLGGDPMLTLALRPRRSAEWALRWLWTVFWFGTGLLVLTVATGAGGRRSPRHVAAAGVFLAGLSALLMLSAPGAWLGLVLILIAGTVWATSPSNRSDWSEGRTAG